MKQPNNLEEAIIILLEVIASDAVNIDYLKKFKNDEDGFIASAHHYMGRNIRNDWFLWWSEKGAIEYAGWPKEKPPIVQFFNDLGIFHADDMSGIILTSLYRWYFDRPIELEKQIEEYKDFWASVNK